MQKIRKRFLLKAYIRAVAAFAIILIGYISLSLYFIKTQSDNISQLRKNEIKRLVTTAYNLITPELLSYESGEISSEEALVRITDTVRKMTYEDTYGKNYLFMSSFSGIMLVQPFETQMEGIDQWNLVDHNGVYIIQELVKAATSQSGDGFVTYHYFNPAQNMIMEKLSYVIGIKELDCYLGAGLYMDDIKAQERASSRNFLILVFFVFTAIFLLSSGIIKPVIKTSEILLNYFEKTADSPEELSVIEPGKYGNNLYTVFMLEGFNNMIRQIKDYSLKLAGSEEKFRSFFANSADAVLFLSHSGRLLEVNDSALEVFGYDRDDLKNEIYLKSFFPDEKKAEKVISLICQSRHVKNLNEKMIKKDRSMIDALITAMISSDKNDTVMLLYLIIRDVTSEKELEKQLVQKQKMETIGSLAGGIAHDFNNYLGAITGSVSLLKYEYELNGYVPAERFEKLAGYLEESCVNASRMITQLQSVSGRHNLDFKVINLSTLAEKVCEICRNTFDKSIDIKLIVNEGNALISGDTRLEQVLLNIFINASHAMTIMREKGSQWGGSLLSSVGTEEIREGSFYTIRYGASAGLYNYVSVRDSGAGIESTIIDKIFDPFYTTKSKGEGSGLGLAVADRTVSDHNGFITVESEYGKGSVFKLYFPALIGSPVIEKNETREFKKLNGRILVIDDEPAFRETVKEMLGVFGLEVYTASGGYEGLEIIKYRSGEIDLVMLDVAMPEISGTDIYPMIKNIDLKIKVILTSGYGSDPRIENLVKTGIDGFLQKPYTLEKLYEKIAPFF